MRANWKVKVRGYTEGVYGPRLGKSRDAVGDFRRRYEVVRRRTNGKADI
jgi:hypothetical protein